MSPVEVNLDYYAILEVPHTATAEIIKKSYRRLAILRHPDKNQNKPDATAAFQLLNSAYETLKEESSRRIYDIKWPHIAQTHRAAQEKAKRDAEAAKSESERAGKYKAARDAEDRVGKSIMEGLAKKKQHYASEVFEANRELKKLESELKIIKEAEDKAISEEKDRNSWFTFARSSIFGAPNESEEAKQERYMQRLQRLASRRIKEEELSRKQKKLKVWTDMLSTVEREISAQISKRREREMQAEREKEEARRREEAKAWKKQQDEFMEQLKARRAAAEAREAQERAAAEARERTAEEQRRKESEKRRNEEERRRKEAEERRKEAEKQSRETAERWRQAREREELRTKVAEEQRKRGEEQRRRNREAEEMFRPWNERVAEASRQSKQDGARAKAKPSRATSSTQNRPSNSPKVPRKSRGCAHRGWWEKVEDGDLMCENCNTMQRRFLFACPGCDMKTCAECRDELKPSGTRRGAPTPRVTRRHKATEADNLKFSFDGVNNDDEEYREPHTFNNDWYD